MNAQQQERKPTELTADSTHASSPGELLKAAREHAGMAAAQVASDLHLDTCIIEALESNSFKILGAPVYAKGYLRKYAKLVGITDETVLRAYEACADVPTVRDPVPSTLGVIPETRRVLSGWAWWTVAILVITAIGVTLLQLRSGAETERAANRSAITSKAPQADTTVEATSSPAPADTAVGQLALQLSFAGDSWVEIYDADNHQVFYGLGSAASRRDLQAMPPLRVVLGSADDVKLSVNGRPLNVPADKVAANVARFVVNADGAIE